MKAYPMYCALCAGVILAGSAFLPRDTSLQGHAVAAGLMILTLALIMHICRSR